MAEGFGYVQDVTADLESGIITSIMVARKIPDTAVLNLKENVLKTAILQSKIKKGQAML